MKAQPSLRERIGGRWALSWQGYLVFLPISTIFILTTTPAFEGGGAFVVGLAISLVAYAATGVVQWLAAISVLRRRERHPVAVWMVVVIGGLSWMVRSVVLWLALEALSLPSLAGLPERMAFGFALGALIVPLTAAGLANLAHFQGRRAALLQELVEVEIATDRERAYVDAIRLGLVEQVTQAVGSARQRMDAIDLSSASMPQEALDALEIASEEGVRRVSRETWQEGRRSGRLRMVDVMRAAASSRPFSLWGVALVSVFGVFLLNRAEALAGTLVIVVGVGTYLAAVVLIVNGATTRGHGSATAYVFGVIALALSGPLTLVVVWMEGLSASFGPSVAILTSSAAIIVIPWTGASRALGQTEERALASLHASIGRAQVQAEALAEQERRLRRQIAIQLHGTVGANLTAATMRLRKAIDAGDMEQATNALFEARRLLDSDLAAVLVAESGDLDQALHDLADSWAGLVDVSVRVTTSELDERHVTAVVDVVTEAINNAARHGRARRVDVSVVSDGRNLVVVVEDDGQETATPRPGLGSRVFDQVAPGTWERSPRAAAGSRLEVRIEGSGTSGNPQVTST